MPFIPRVLPLVDTHAHLNLEDFAPDFDAVLSRSRAGVFPLVKGRPIDANVMRPFLAAAICPAVDWDSTRRALQLAARCKFLFAAAGIHPNYTAEATEGDWREIERVVLDGESFDDAVVRPVALGETGLDRYWDDSPFDLQREYFLKHLELGRRAGLPTIVHCRDANDDLDAVFTEFFGANSDFAPGVVHSFSGTPEQAERWVELGFYLGFGGVVTYTNKK
ncbi:MAG: TatD family hydrolase, partial [Thermoguttaceae bacterium]|nr:TatD family hydrolase [Thermoguttaceae bacterium]